MKTAYPKWIWQRAQAMGKKPDRWSKADWSEVAIELAKEKSPGLIGGVLADSFRQPKRPGAKEKYSPADAARYVAAAAARRDEMQRELGRVVTWIEVFENSVARWAKNDGRTLSQRNIRAEALKAIEQLRNYRRKVARHR